MVLSGLLLFGQACQAEEDAVDRFFSGCPHRPRIAIHHDDSALDLHALALTTSNLMELEVIRLADWVLDIPLPTIEMRPLERTVNGIRVDYDRLADHHLLLERFGELVDALQLRELSLGDVASTYTAATGGEINPGSGTLVRVNKLIDWTQRVVGDLNYGAGWLVRHPQGLITWRLPVRVVDQTQKGVIRTFHGLSLIAAKTVDRLIIGLENTAEVIANAPRPTPHARTTVFLRMPAAVYHVHELWIIQHQRQIYAGTAEELAGLTHQDLFHPRHRQRPRPAWWSLERFHEQPAIVVLVTDWHTIETAPLRLRDYVVPAAWAFAGPPPAAEPVVDKP